MKNLIKKILLLMFPLIFCLSMMGCGIVTKDVENSIIEAYDEFIENYDYEDTDRCTVEKISYTINEIKKVSKDYYFVDVTWEIDISDSSYDSESELKESWVSKVQRIGQPFIYNSEKDKSFSISYYREEVDDSIRVKINGSDAYSGSDYFEENIEDYDDRRKCSWCGKIVDNDDMKGDWCKDCQNNAFGKDGWYHDIKDQ